MAISEAGREELFGGIATKDMGLTIDETVGGLALIVLAILALAGIDPPLLLAIATIVAGAALLFMSVAFASEFSNALALSGRAPLSPERSNVWSAGSLGGAIGIVLGILALLDVAPATLMAVALIVFGAAVFLDFIMMSQARALRMTVSRGGEPFWPGGEAARSAFSAAASSDMGSLLFGFALVLLGIVALTGLNTEVLIAVALLGLGGYCFLKGTAVITQLLSSKTFSRTA
jgi:hypothetical protein